VVGNNASNKSRNKSEKSNKELHRR
jgi:hypothetical protein